MENGLGSSGIQMKDVLAQLLWSCVMSLPKTGSGLNVLGKRVQLSLLDSCNPKNVGADPGDWHGWEESDPTAQWSWGEREGDTSAPP